MSLDTLRTLLTPFGRLLLSENLLIVGLVMWSTRGHFKALKGGLADVAKQLQMLSSALLTLETKHTERIVAIETRVKTLEDHNKQRRRYCEATADAYEIKGA